MQSSTTSSLHFFCRFFDTPVYFHSSFLQRDFVTSQTRPVFLSFMNFDVNFRLNVFKSLVKRNLVVILMFQNGAVTANTPFAILAVKPHFIYMYCTIFCPTSITLHIAGLEISDIFYMVAAENLSLLVDADAFITHKAVAFKAVIFQSFRFVAGSTVRRIFFPLATVSLHYFHHLLVKKVGWEAVNVVVRTLCDLTTCRTTQLPFTLLPYPTFQTSLAERVETFQYFWFTDLIKMLLTNRTFQFFFDIIEKGLTLRHYF